MPKKREKQPKTFTATATLTLRGPVDVTAVDAEEAKSKFDKGDYDANYAQFETVDWEAGDFKEDK